MKVVIEELLNKAKANDLDWLDKSNIKSRIKIIIKKNKLSSEIIDYLWEKRNFRWELTRFQKLSVSQMQFIIDHFSSTSRREVSGAIFSEMLKKQDIDDVMLTSLLDLDAFHLHDVCKVWQFKAQRIVELGKVDWLVDMIFDDYVIEGEGLNNISKAIISTIEVDKNYLDVIVDKLIKVGNWPTQGRLLNILGKSFNFPDHLVNKLYEDLNPYIFESFFQIVESRDHCSISIKAKYLLAL